METGGIDATTCEVLEIAAVALDPHTLEVKQDDKFHIFLKPLSWENVSQEALAVNKITREEIEQKGVELKLGWGDFVKWVRKYDTKNTFWSRPVALGHNIINYDMVIVERLSKLYGPVDKDGRSTLFHGRDKWDLMNFCSTWFERAAEPKNYKLDTLREFFGLSKENAHSATIDVEQSAYLIAKFIKLQRGVFKKIKFQGDFKTNGS